MPRWTRSDQKNNIIIVRTHERSQNNMKVQPVSVKNISTCYPLLNFRDIIEPKIVHLWNARKAVLVQSSQILYIIMINMLFMFIKKSFKVTESKQLWKDERTKFPPERSKLLPPGVVVFCCCVFTLKQSVISRRQDLLGNKIKRPSGCIQEQAQILFRDYGSSSACAVLQIRDVSGLWQKQ